MADIPITIDAGTSKRLLTEGKYCDKNILVTAEGGGDDLLLSGVIARSITEITSSDITEIGNYAFCGCASLVTVDLPSAKRVRISSFQDCTALSEINLPTADNVLSSGFKGCTSLQKISLPNLNSIYYLAFSGCTNLTAVILPKEKLCVLLGINAFDGTPIASGTGYIYVPKSLSEDYKQATNWTAFADQIRAIEDYPEIVGGTQV